MEITKLPLGLLQTNCYIIRTSPERAAVIDPGDEAERLFRWFEHNGCVPARIFLTHGHFDHTGAVDSLREKYGCPVYITEADVPMMKDAELSMSALVPGSPYRGFTADKFYSDGDKIEQDGVVFNVAATPGHTAGSVCLIAENAIFSGDTLFAGSVGRTDCPTGSYGELMRSLEKLKRLEGDYELYCGHGEASTLSCEKLTNPFML